MFIFFAQAKTNYKLFTQKGQIAPFLIAILAIIVMAIMVTVNLGKIGLIKTHTANAADAGALAAASNMAFAFNLLNAQAMQMYNNYQDFYLYAISPLIREAQTLLVQIIITSTIMSVLMAVASAVACIPPAAGYIIYGAMMWASISLLLLISGYYFPQFLQLMGAVDSNIETLYNNQKDFFCQIREMMDENVGNSREMAKDLAFINSGISGQLNDKLDKNGNPISEEGLNQPKAFSNFIDQSPTPDEPFGWTDGQNRTHSVQVTVGLRDVERYVVEKTNKTYGQIRGLFTGLYATSIVLGGLWLALGIQLKVAAGIWLGSKPCLSWTIGSPIIGCPIPFICTLGMAKMKVALIELLSSFVFLAGLVIIVDKILEGIGRNGTQPSRACWDVDDNILTTITAVEHPRDLTVSTEQFHQPADLGLWQADYGRITSSSRASFSTLDGSGDNDVDGRGGPHPHNPRLAEVE